LVRRIDRDKILVFFIIRTWGSWRSRPDRVLTPSSLLTLAAAITLALTPFGRTLGFVACRLPC